MPASSQPEMALLDALYETDLTGFRRKLCQDLQLTRLEHFEHVRDQELQTLAGLSAPAIRRLRYAIEEKKKRSRKFLTLFGSLPRKDTKISSPCKSEVAETTCLIGKDQIRLMEKIGEGGFAVVKRAVWTTTDGHKLDVAVKLLRDSTGVIVEDLQSEVDMMHRLKHPNLIRLHGLVFSTPLMMIFELCEDGALLDRLRTYNKPVLLSSQSIDYSVQIAKGMAYLESRRFIHRDLAARNVLLCSNERILQNITNGQVLPKPTYCPQQLYDLLLCCWSIEPEERPKFHILKDQLKEFHLSICECREAQKDGDYLEMEVNDKLLIIEGSNVSGSFIHAGHMDAGGGPSWGQAGEIDQIYLKNPLTQGGPLPSRSIKGAELVPSIRDLDLRAVSLRPPPPTVKRNNAPFRPYSSTISLNPVEIDAYDIAIRRPISERGGSDDEAIASRPVYYAPPDDSRQWPANDSPISHPEDPSQSREMTLYTKFVKDSQMHPLWSLPTTPKCNAVSIAPFPPRGLLMLEESDPFEVPSSVRQLTNRPRYSQMYQHSVIGEHTVHSRPSVQSAIATSNVSSVVKEAIPNQRVTVAGGRASFLDTASNSTSCLHPSVPAVESTKCRSLSTPDTQTVLDLFDPLVPKTGHLVDQVHSLAPFATWDRCASLLRRCRDDVQSAVKELKVEKLLDMGLVDNRHKAVATLQSADWDPNLAAEILLA